MPCYSWKFWWISWPFIWFQGRFSNDEALNGRLVSLSNVDMITNAYVEKLLTDEIGKRNNAAAATTDLKKNIALPTLLSLPVERLIARYWCCVARTGNIRTDSCKYFRPGSRNLMLHHNGCLVAFTKRKKWLCVFFQKSLGLADFYYFGADDSAYPIAEIQLMGREWCWYDRVAW